MIDTIIQGDCLQVMREIESGSIDLVITDPPYGIGRDKGFGGGAAFGNGCGKLITRKTYSDTWDEFRPTREYFEEVIRISKQAIIFGGNFFSDILPVGNHWIVWDKMNTMPTFGDCELAWTNIKRNSIKKVTVTYNGLIGKEYERYHPTQKPVALFRWLIENYSKEGMVICDPFAGSGTTAVAAIQTGRHYICIEQDERYCEIARKRAREAREQLTLL